MKITLIAIGIILGIIYLFVGSGPKEPAAEVRLQLENTSDSHFYNPSKICNVDSYTTRGVMVEQLTECLTEEKEWFKL